MFSLRIDDDLELRLLEERHAEALSALSDQNRAYLRLWMPWVDQSRTVEDRRNFIKRSLEQFANNDGFAAGIWFRGRLAGVIGIHRIDRLNRTTSIGYWLGSSFQGRGIMTRACRALVDCAFNELGLNRVEIRCATENRKSRAISERLGFTQEGVIRQAEWLYDHFVDHVVYGMLAGEWRAIARQNG